jgi:hypothetical protein
MLYIEIMVVFIQLLHTFMSQTCNIREGKKKMFSYLLSCIHNQPEPLSLL